MVSDHLFVILSKVIVVRQGQHITDQHSIQEKSCAVFQMSVINVCFNGLKIQKLTDL